MQYLELLRGYVGAAPGCFEFSRGVVYAGEPAYRPDSYLWELWTGGGSGSYFASQGHEGRFSKKYRTSKEGWLEEGRWLWDDGTFIWRADQHEEDGEKGKPHINVDLKGGKKKSSKKLPFHFIDLSDKE